jgi:hypothetical protein
MKPTSAAALFLPAQKVFGGGPELGAKVGGIPYIGVKGFAPNGRAKPFTSLSNLL